MTKTAHLSSRAVLALTGADRIKFLNGLVSNDVALVAPGRAVWAALLTPQGKWLADFFIFDGPEGLLLDVEAAQAAMLTQRLLRYRLRADVAIAPTDLRVFAAWDGTPETAETIAAPDPRVETAGWRLLATTMQTNNTAENWDAHRLALALPDGSRDMESEKSTLLEAGFDSLNGISWTKGCYMGQELTARTRYRGLLKRRLTPVTSDGVLPPPGTPVTKEGQEVGALRSARGSIGLALLRLDALEGRLEAGGTTLTVGQASWAAEPAET